MSVKEDWLKTLKETQDRHDKLLKEREFLIETIKNALECSGIFSKDIVLKDALKKIQEGV